MQRQSKPTSQLPQSQSQQKHPNKQQKLQTVVLQYIDKQHIYHTKQSIQSKSIQDKQIQQLLQNQHKQEQQSIKKIIKSNKYNITNLKTCMMQQKQLTKFDMIQLINKFKNIIKYQQNLIKINGNTIVIGDIHGQYYDFVKILNLIKSNYKYTDLHSLLECQYMLFLGDYVDRGYYSIQVLTLIMALKINHPNHVYCLRGNHQCRLMTSLYNFKAEVLIKYDQEVYDNFIEMFDMLPIACVINNNYFCVHGGISDEFANISQINKIDRFKQIPDKGAFCDFMWADPISVQYQKQYKMYDQSQFNNVRMCSIFFGKKLVNKFLKNNHLKTIIRAHEVFPQGYQRRDWYDSNTNNDSKIKLPSLITIFSAPNYCGIYGNLGAILHINSHTFQIRQYKDQPFTKLHNVSLDVIQWSIPYITRVINQFTKNLMEALGHMYLKQFPYFSQTSHEQRLKILLDYCGKHPQYCLKNENSIKFGNKQQNDLKNKNNNNLDLKKQFHKFEDQKDQQNKKKQFIQSQKNENHFQIQKLKFRSKSTNEINQIKEEETQIGVSKKTRTKSWQLL